MSLYAAGYDTNTAITDLDTDLVNAVARTLTALQVSSPDSQILRHTPLPLSPHPPHYLHDDKTRDTRSVRARIRLGRTRLPTDLQRTGQLQGATTCPECPGKELTADHALLRCPRTFTARSNLYFQHPDVQWHQTLDYHIDTPPEYMHLTSSFIRECQLVWQL